MTALLAFALTLLVAVLLSERAHRSVLAIATNAAVWLGRSISRASPALKRILM